MMQQCRAIPVLLIFASLVACDPLPKLDTSNIVNGVTAAPLSNGIFGTEIKNNGQYPYIASLQTINQVKKTSRHRCVGAIIKDDAIITAAHCTENVIPANLCVRVGTLSLTDSTGVQLRNVIRVLRHPKHKELNDDNNDIGIVWVYPKFKLGKFVNIIHLADQDFIGEKSFTLGWGNDATAKPTNFLMRGDLSIIGESECKQLFTPIPNKNITDSMICAIDKNRRQTTCSGDSGGPLIIRKTNDPKDDVLLGTTSWGIGYKIIEKLGHQIFVRHRCEPNYPAVFAKVPKFKKWIDKNLLWSLNFE